MKFKLTKSNDKLCTALVAALLAAGAASPAFADTLSTTVGPVPLVPAPLNVCVGATCEKTPNLGSLTLTIGANIVDALGLLPAITPGACPAGQAGVAFVVEANGRNTVVNGVLSGALGQMTFSKPIGPVTVPAARTLVISACSF